MIHTINLNTSKYYVFISILARHLTATAIGDIFIQIIYPFVKLQADKLSKRRIN